MKKGDLKKQEILDTAEILFCRNGYEQTSIQDILDRLNSSKGSFYHHFVSKEALLEAICRKRANQIYSSVTASSSENESNTENLNTMLSGMIPLHDHKLSFLMMLLPIFHLPEGRMIQLCYCDALSFLFYPNVYDILKSGHQNGDFVCPDPQTAADLILSIVNRLWCQICIDIIIAEEKNTEADLSELLRLTDCYRLTIERMISLPYGSLQLVDIPTLGFLTGQIHNHWRHKNSI